MTDKEIPGLTRSGDLLTAEKSTSDKLLENPFISAAAHTLIQTPVDAIAQVVDKTSGSNLLPSLRLIPEAAKAEFGSSDWFQQQIGGALGALPYLVALHQGSRAALSNRMLSADTRLMLNAGVRLGSTGARELATLELASAGLTGFAYGGLLVPLRPDETQSTGSFIGAKLRNATVSGGTFLTLSASMLGTKSLAESLKPGLVKTVLGSDIGAGMLSGAPAGTFNAQADSILRGKGFAGLKDTGESMLGFAVIGGLLPAGQKGVKSLAERLQPVKPASDVISIESLTPREAAQFQEPGRAPKVKPVHEVFTAEKLKTLQLWKEMQATLEETRFRESEPLRIQQLADEAYGTGAPAKGRKLHILLGNCGAGKSRVTDALARELGAMTPDSDHIKVKIPGYDDGLGNQAVHEDSSAAYKILLDRALQTGDNIVWQGVGKTAKSITDLISQAKTHGYEVTVHMIDAPPEIAAMRVFDRANRPPDPGTGIRQMIPPEVPLNPKYQYVPRLNFFKMIGDAAAEFQNNGVKTIDGFRLWRSTSEIHNKFLPTAGTLPTMRPAWLPAIRADNDESKQVSAPVREASLAR